jgi:hypothetical protein
MIFIFNTFRSASLEKLEFYPPPENEDQAAKEQRKAETRKMLAQMSNNWVKGLLILVY